MPSQPDSVLPNYEKSSVQSGDFVPMIANARDLAANGITTVDEVVREVATIE
jgi:hypothetical protein